MVAVDTHVLIWDALASERLSRTASAAVRCANESDGIVVADICLWEIAMLLSKDGLQVNTSCADFLRLIQVANQIHVRAITPCIAELSAQLPPSINSDPADRFIVATALVHGVALVTADRNLRSAPDLVRIR